MVPGAAAENRDQVIQRVEKGTENMAGGIGVMASFATRYQE
jgi:hypothetical protein